MATIKEIAEKCGVSTATVSKALNGYSDIGEETTSLVRETARLMGYFPNSAARALKTKRSNSLGILFIDQMQSGLGHEYFSSLLESFKAEAEGLGYDITFISQNLGGNRMRYLDHCRYRQCDGVLIASIDFEDPQILELVNSEIPVVTIDHVFNDVSAVMSDNVRGMQDLLHFIYECGHRKIAYIHGEDTSVTKKRLASFYRTCEKLGVIVPNDYMKSACYHDLTSSRIATRELLSLEDRPTCILYPDDFSYMGGVDELELAGVKVPQDISVAGFDGIKLSQMLRPKLTTLYQNTVAIGSVAAKILVKTIEEPKTTFPDQIVIAGRLLPGETVRVIESE